MKTLSAKAKPCGCGRILFPTADNRWPAHLAVPVADRNWCDRSGEPISQPRSKAVVG